MYGPISWNMLPTDFTNMPTLYQFKGKFKKPAYWTPPSRDLEGALQVFWLLDWLNSVVKTHRCYCSAIGHDILVGCEFGAYAHWLDYGWCSLVCCLRLVVTLITELLFMICLIGCNACWAMLAEQFFLLGSPVVHCMFISVFVSVTVWWVYVFLQWTIKHWLIDWVIEWLIDWLNFTLNCRW